jgi:hypothetical protein
MSMRQTDTSSKMSQSQAPSQSDPYFQTLDLAFIGSMVPGIIHNLATPLSGVLGATQLLEKRTASFEEVLNKSESLDESDQLALQEQLERHRTNVEILARNAQHLADILQVLVQRINRGSHNGQAMHSLSDLVQQELKFLDANLIFKHKVRKNVSLCAELKLEKFIYGHVAATLDEFVTAAIARHDFAQAMLDMDFITSSEDDSASLTLTAHLSPCTNVSEHGEMLEPCLDRLRAEGWHTEIKMANNTMGLKLTCPKSKMIA